MPTGAEPEWPQTEIDEEQTDQESSHALDTLEVAKPRPAPENEKFYSTYRHRITPAYGQITFTKENQTSVFVNLTYQYLSESFRSVDVGFLLANDGLSYIQANYIKYFRFTTSFRPYLKPGIACRLEAKENFGTFFTYRNYLIRMGAGGDYYFSEFGGIELEANYAYGDSPFWTAYIGAIVRF